MRWTLILVSCLFLCTAAEAIQITKPRSGETAVNENMMENAVVTNSGHYAFASGTSAPYTWSSIPSAAVVWDFSPDPVYRHTVRFMIQTGYLNPVIIKVFDTGDETAHSITVYPVTLTWIDNYGGFGGGSPGPDRIVNNWLGGLRGERKVYFYAVGSAPIADLRIRTYPNKLGATGRIDVVEFDDDSSTVVEVTPHCGNGEWKVVVPVMANPQGELHSLTIKGEFTSSKVDDIEIDLVDRQVGASLCFDGIGAVLEYTVVHTDFVFEGMSEQEEEIGAYLEVGGAAANTVLQRVVPDDFQGTIQVDKYDPPDRIETSTMSGAALPLPHEVAANGDLSFDFYVSGAAASADVGDIDLFSEPVASDGQGPVVLGGGTCRDGITLTVVKATVKRDIAGGSVEWQDISGAPAVVVVGQKVNLKAELEPESLQPSAYAWSIEGLKKFKDYTASKSEATVTELEEDDLDDEIIHFYWARGTNGAGEAVQCDMLLNLPNLTTIRAADVMSVKEPTLSDLDKHIGLVEVVDWGGGGDWQFRLMPSGGPDGMHVQCEVDDPTGYSEGRWHFVQTVTLGTWVTTLDGSKLRLAHTGETVLDTEYPFSPTPVDPDPGWPGSWETGGSSVAQDHPWLSLADFQSIRVDETFRMYVMYLPPGDEARWVPAGCWLWTWEGEATLSNGTWTLSDEDQMITDCYETNEHPTWTAYYDGEWEPDTD